MFKMFRQSAVNEVEEVIPRIITISCRHCGKEFGHAVFACNDLPNTFTVRQIIHYDNSFGLWLFCSKECAEEFMENGKLKM